MVRFRGCGSLGLVGMGRKVRNFFFCIVIYYTKEVELGFYCRLFRRKVRRNRY